ncbi:MAG: SDR family oxidoreductase, partial [Planctomycetaceae bacterium]|nr:SDR family oxidoreductase [Planctomycetaceae bacterium]
MPQHIGFDFSGTNVVIAGASGGIGSKIAQRFLETGASLFLHTFRNEHTIQNLFANKCSYCAADFSKPEERQRFFERVANYFPKIDVWVNAAGLDLMSEEIKQLRFEEKLRRIIETDVIAPIEFAEKIAAVMRKQTGGTIFFFGWD